MKTASRRQFSAGLLAAGASTWLPALAQSDLLAGKAVRYVVPFPPGGLTDVMARLMAQKLSESLKANVLVDNKPGGNANLGADFVAKAAPDGQTWLAVTLTHTVNASMFPGLPYNIEKSLVPVVHLATSPLLLVVNAKSPFKTLKELMDKAKTQVLNAGSSGNGSPPHLGLELFAHETKLSFTHIPYKGGAPSLNDLMGGQTDFIVSNLPESVGFVKAGRLRALAVAASQRVALLPEVPTFAELGLPAMELENWTGMMMPAGTPAAVVEQVSAMAVRLVKSPDVAERMGAQGFTITGLGAAEFAQVVQRDVARWREIVKLRQIKPD